MWFVNPDTGVREFAAPGTDVYERFVRSPLWQPTEPLAGQRRARLKLLPPAGPPADLPPPDPEAA